MLGRIAWLQVLIAFLLGSFIGHRFVHLGHPLANSTT